MHIVHTKSEYGPARETRERALLPPQESHSFRPPLLPVRRPAGGEERWAGPQFSFLFRVNWICVILTLLVLNRTITIRKTMPLPLQII